MLSFKSPIQGSPLSAILAAMLVVGSASPAVADSYPGDDAAGDQASPDLQPVPDFQAVPNISAAAAPQGVLDSSGQAVEGATYYYTGAAIDPVAKVDGMADGSYIVKYLNNKAAPSGNRPATEASTAAAIVCAPGGRADSGTAVLFKIRKRNLDGEFEIDEVKAQAAGARPKLSIRAKSGGTALVEGKDYALSYSDGASTPGSKATVTATALDTSESLCAGSVSVEYSVLACEDADELLVDAIGTQAYTGKAVEPDVKVRFKPKGGQSRELAPSDYEVSFKDNVAEGTATVTVTGKGDYTGLSASATFQIAKEGSPDSNGGMSVAGADIELSPKSAVFTGQAIKPAVSVTLDGKKLSAADYDVSYSGNVNAGTATATVKGKGSYSGTASKTFEIGKAKIGDANAVIKDQKYAGGKEVTPTPTVTYKGQALKEGVDFTLDYKGNKNPGAANAVLTGKGNFTGTETVKFTIGDATIADAEISDIPDYYADGLKKVKPKVTVKVAGKKLEEGTDYTVKYDDNKKPGTAKAIVKGKGKYSGKQIKKFTLVNVGDDVAKKACRLSYSRKHGGNNGTSLYRSKGGRADCGMGMVVAFRSSGHYDNLWHRDKAGWTFICQFDPDKSPEKQGMLPGDLLVKNGSGFHTLMYVGTEIPLSVYEKKLKGTEADLGKPVKGSNFCSAHHSYDGGAGLCICKKGWGLATSSCKVYRVRHDDKAHRAGKKVS